MIGLYCQIRCIALRVLNGFWVFCSINHLSGGGVNIKSQCLNALSQLGPQKQNWEWRRKPQWWVEFLSRERGRHCFILARDKNKKDQKTLSSKVVDYSPKQGDQKQRTSKHRNKPNGSKSYNHKSQTMTFWTRSSKRVFPKRSAKMINGTENPQNSFEVCKTRSAMQLIW